MGSCDHSFKTCRNYIFSSGHKSPLTTLLLLPLTVHLGKEKEQIKREIFDLSPLCSQLCANCSFLPLFLSQWQITVPVSVLAITAQTVFVFFLMYFNRHRQRDGSAHKLTVVVVVVVIMVVIINSSTSCWGARVRKGQSTWDDWRPCKRTSNIPQAVVNMPLWLIRPDTRRERRASEGSWQATKLSPFSLSLSAKHLTTLWCWGGWREWCRPSP